MIEFDSAAANIGGLSEDVSNEDTLIGYDYLHGPGDKELNYFKIIDK